MRLHCFLPILVLLAALPAEPVAAADFKAVPASACTAYGPDTTLSELAFSPTGIYNPGTASEKVFCALPRDQNSAFVDGNLTVNVYYRVLGGTPARVTCTLWVGTTAMEGTAAYSETVAGPLASAGGRAALALAHATQQDFIYAIVPVSLLCVIPPKTTLGAIVTGEQGLTD
jgi:hypothetical protein